MSELTLRPLTPVHCETLVDWIGNENDMVMWTGGLFSWPLTPAQLERFFFDRDIRGFIAVSDRADGHSLVGLVAFKNFSNAKKHTGLLIAVLIAPEFRGKGFCGQLMTAGIKIGFDELDLHRIELNVFEQNTAAISCYENCGFEREGFMRDVCRVNNGYWNLVNMAIVKRSTM